MQKLFSGLRVLDLSTVLAGPSVASFFAELGADVTKVENPTTNGDVTRTWKLPGETKDSRISAYFASVNFGKKYVWLDLKNEHDKLRIDEFIMTSDVVITNFKKGDDIKFGLTTSRIFELNPGVIQAKISGYAGDSDRIAYDVVLQAESGFMYMNGTPESGPVKMPVALIDVLAAHQLKEGILCALLQREKSGRGSIVECSLEKAALASLANQASNFLMTGHIPQRLGSLHPNIAPYGEIMTCKDDKQLVLAVGSDKQFLLLCTALGIPQLAGDPQFSSNPSRVVNRKVLFEKISPAFRSKTRIEWNTIFNHSQIPAGAILNLEEVFAGPVAQSMVISESIDGIETSRVSSVAFEIRQES